MGQTSEEFKEVCYTEDYLNFRRYAMDEGKVYQEQAHGWHSIQRVVNTIDLAMQDLVYKLVPPEKPDKSLKTTQG